MIHQDVSLFDLAMYFDFVKWQFQLPIQETFLPCALEWFVLYFWGHPHRALAKRVIVDMPFVTRDVGCEPPSCFPASSTCSWKFLSARSPYPGAARDGDGRRQRQMEGRTPSELVPRFPHLPLHAWLSYRWRGFQDATFAFREIQILSKV